VVWLAWYRDPPADPGTAARGGDLPPPPAVPAHPPVPWRGLFRSRRLWVIMAMAWCYGWGSSFYIDWLHTYLVKGRGFTELALALSSLTYIVGATANGLGWHRWRLGGQTLWPAQRPPLARRSGTQRGGAVPDCGHLRADRQPSARVPVVRYGGILFQQPTLCALDLDVGRKNAGGLWLHEHGGQCRVGRFLLGLWLHGWLLRELTARRSSPCATKRFLRRNTRPPDKCNTRRSRSEVG